MRKKVFLLFLLLFLISCTQSQIEEKNIILFIGDGMGPVQVDVAGIYANGSPDTLSFEQFPVQTSITTYSADNSITDSAASATAMATGHKVNNGVVSVQIPGDGNDLTTILELLQNEGFNTGLISTAHMTHATPAAFASHVTHRSDYNGIGNDYFTQTRPHLLLGGGGNGISVQQAQDARYATVENITGMQGISITTSDRISGQFGSDHIPYEYDGLGELPGLADMTQFALEYMEQKGKSFFLMIEGARIDHACHDNDLIRAIYETLEFAAAVQIAHDWASNRDDTIIIVTADHETGGLELIQNNGQGNLPDVSWSTTGHTSTSVDVFAWGYNSELISSVEDNSDFFSILLNR